MRYFGTLRGIEGSEDKVASGEVGSGAEEFDTNNTGGKERSKMKKNDGKGWRFEEVGGSAEAWTHQRSLWNGGGIDQGIGGSCAIIADDSHAFIESLIDTRNC